MRNSVTCEHCQTENPFYRQTCSNCRAFLRARVVNINLWQTVGRIIESPADAFRKMIFSEHKNFIIFISLLAAIKFSFWKIILSNIVGGNAEAFDYPGINILLSSGYFLVLILIFSIFVQKLNKMFSLTTRWRDNYTILVYSFIPVLLALVILIPMEFALFGSYFLTFNPSPFLIKPGAAYILAGLECLLVIWSVILFITANVVQSRLKIYSIILGILLAGLLFAAASFLPVMPFNLN